jgi:iron complex outermembrane receptor protein
VNFNASWENIAQTPISASAFITNAFNQRYFSAVSPSGGLGASLRYLGEPRMYGMRAKVSF